MSSELASQPHIRLEKVSNKESLGGLFAESSNSFLPNADSPEQTLADLLEIFADDPALCIYGIESDGELATFLVQLSGKSDDEVAIGPMFVGRSHRRQGLGLLQIRQFIDLKKEEGYSSIFTKTWSGNQASQRIFEELGFSVVRIIEGDRANGDDTLEYRLTV